MEPEEREPLPPWREALHQAAGELQSASLWDASTWPLIVAAVVLVCVIIALA